MKKAIILLPAIIALLSIGACKKSTPGFTGATWSASVNGQSKSGYALVTYTSELNELSISFFPSANSSSPNMSISTGLQDSVMVHTGIYPLNGPPSEAFYNIDTTNSVDLVSSYGQLNIIQLNFKANTISGTFNFSCAPSSSTGDSVIVTNGLVNGGMEGL